MKNISLRAITRSSVQALLAATLFAAPIAAFAQDDPNAAPAVQSAPSAGSSAAPAMSMHHHREGMGMWKNLDLTDDQKAQIKTIREQFRDKLKADHESGNIDATKSDRKAMMEQVMAVLTPDQREKLKSMRKEHKMSGSQPNQMPTVAP